MIMKKPHVCILTSQYFNWGKYGGFGSMSRKLAEGLVRLPIYAGLTDPQVDLIIDRTLHHVRDM